MELQPHRGRISHRNIFDRDVGWCVTLVHEHKPTLDTHLNTLLAYESRLPTKTFWLSTFTVRNRHEILLKPVGQTPPKK